MIGRRHNLQPLAEDSFLRAVDPRTKLAIALLASFALMLELPGLAIFSLAFATLIGLAGIGPYAWAQIRRIRWLLIILFALDWFLVSPRTAVEVTLRLALLVSAFQLLTATTHPDELRRALERLGLPEPIALSLAVAQRTLADLELELRRIVDAQRARGIDFDGGRRSGRLRRWWSQSIAVAVPAVVMATKRAWSAHEAAAVRGFGAPRYHDATSDALPPRDRALLLGSVALFVVLAWWR